MVEQREKSSSIMRTLLLGWIIGATMTFSQVMPRERAPDMAGQTLSIARAMTISLIWPLYWGYRMFDRSGASASLGR